MRLSCLLALALTSPLAAQSGEAAKVMEPITRLFDGMRAHDSLMVLSAFAPDARLVSKDRTGALRYLAAQQFARAVGSATGEPWDEPIYEPQVLVDGDVAVVWAKYDFLRGSTWSHCGIDAFMLSKTPDGWRITQLADTRQTTGCTTPRAPR
jgi:ketosteroid isomerase-like protein